MDNGFIAKFRFPDLDFVINNYTIRELLNKYRDCFVPRNDAPNLRHCER